MDAIIEAKKQAEQDILNRIREFEKVLNDFTSEEHHFTATISIPPDGYGRAHRVFIELSEYNSREHKTTVYH